MASQAPTTTRTYVNEDIGSPEAMPPTMRLSRRDTSSSTGSAARPPHGNWAINISGVCPSCHHYHRSLQVHVRISGDFNQVGDVYCKKCQRLWLAFGNTNATRLSLLSSLTVEPDPIENEFHSTLIHMIRSITPIAVLSPVLTVIPEATSASLSRETSVRSTAGRGARRLARNPLDDTTKTSVNNTTAGHKFSRRSLANGRRMLSSVKQRAAARFIKSQHIPFGLRRWFVKKESLELRSHQHDPATPPTDAPLTTTVATSPFGEPTEAQEANADFDPAALDVSASSANAVDALASLKALNPQALENLPHQERISWARKQLTDFRARYSSITTYMTTHDTRNGEGLHDYLGYSPPRRHSVLAHVGGVFDPYEEWNIYRERERRASGRPWSISETQTSEADTLVDGLSISSSPRHIFIETLHRDHRRSLSPRPVSTGSAVQDWPQIHRNRTEARRSIDSTVTGGNVRSITTTRNHAPNRLSRGSIRRASSAYGTEPTASRAQLRVDEETEEEGASQRRRAPETDGTNPPE